MRRFARLSAMLLLSYCIAACLIGSQAQAQQDAQPEATAPGTSDQDWYYGDNDQQPEKSIGRLRSEQRAQQRMARLESMRWYGFSASRPTASAMPFTTMYSPAWTRSGGRPFAWYTGERPVYAPRYVYYR
jgi:hypothetical protein